MLNPFAQITPPKPQQAQRILYAYRLPGDLILPREELISRGVPPAHLTLRSGPQALQMAFSHDNRSEWSLTGKGRNWRLHDPDGVMAASISFAPGSDTPRVQFREDWQEYKGFPMLDEADKASVRSGIIDTWQQWIQERIDYHRAHIDRQNIQRSFERWLTGAGAKDEIIPSLKSIPAEQEHILARASTALPEAEWAFWRVNV